MQKLRLAKDLREDLAILKLKKGNVIVLINKSDSYQSLEGLFSDKSKFRLIDEDPTLTHLSPLQKYLRILFNCGKINEDQVKKLRPQNAIVALAYALPKIYKNFTRLPSFRTIFYTTSPCYYDAGSLVTDLLTPITHSDFFSKDSFDAAAKICKFPPQLFDNGYIFATFDVAFLFKNVPFNRTANVILDRVYNENLEYKLKHERIEKSN